MAEDTPPGTGQPGGGGNPDVYTTPGFYPSNSGTDEDRDAIEEAGRRNEAYQNESGQAPSNFSGGGGSGPGSVGGGGTDQGSGSSFDYSGLRAAFEAFLNAQLGYGKNALNAEYESRGVYESSSRRGALGELEQFVGAERNLGLAQIGADQRGSGSQSSSSGSNPKTYPNSHRRPPAPYRPGGTFEDVISYDDDGNWRFNIPGAI